MNVDELRGVLDAEAEPVRRDVVLAAIASRRGARHRHRLLAGGCALIVLATVGVGAAVWRPWSTGHADSSTSPMPGTQPQVAGGCAGIALQDDVAQVSRNGGSVIEAYGRLTDAVQRDGATPYREMTLTGVRTLAGAPVSPIAAGWLPSTPVAPGSAGGGSAGVWAADGHLVALVEPATVTGTAVGPVLRVAPVVGSSVILSSAGCWTSDGLTTRAYTGPLAEIPGTGAVAAATTTGGFRAFPLAAFAALATH